MKPRPHFLFLLLSLACAGAGWATPASNLAATNIAGTTIDLKWTGSSPYGYRIIDKTGVFPTYANDASATYVETAAVTVRLTNLSSSTTYYIAVYAQLSNARHLGSDARVTCDHDYSRRECERLRRFGRRL